MATRGIRLKFGDAPLTLQSGVGRYGVLTPHHGLASSSNPSALVAASGTYVYAGQGASFSQGGAGTPGIPSSVVLYSDGTPGTAYATFAMPTDGGSQITQFQGLLSPSGITGTQSRYTIVDALSCRVDFIGVPNTAQTAQIRAVNANGAGSYSSSSNSVTPAAYSDTWPNDSHNMHVVMCGGSQVGLSSLWHDGYFNNQNVRYVSPGTATSGTFATSMNAPSYPTGLGFTNQLMAEVTPQSNAGYGFLVNILLQNPATGSNGAFNANPYTRFCGYIYPVKSGGYALGKTEATINVEGVVSNVSSNVLTFANQTLATNAFISTSTGIFNRANGGSSGYTSNTATTVTDNNAGGLNASVGDHILVQQGDQTVGLDAGDISTYIKSPSAGTLTLNQWNRFEVPLDNTGWGMLAVNGGLHYKWNVACPVSGGNGVTYFCYMGFVV